MTRKTSAALSLSTLLVCAGTALANPVNGNYFDDANGCDSHGPQLAYEELGTGPLFPQNELIFASWAPTPYLPCVTHDDGTGVSAQVRIVNLTGQAWADLYYVADPETNVTNVDGFATSVLGPAGVICHAFRIDSLGMNTNLVSESQAADGIFAPGEVWEFVIQNYSNSLGLAPSDLGSLDFAGGSLGNSLSSGSIVAMKAVPAPGALAVLGLAGCVSLRRRR